MPPSQIETKFAHVADCLKRINALCKNPHWDAKRRWRIEELSREALVALDEAVRNVENMVSNMVKE